MPADSPSANLILKSSDLTATIAWYRSLGFELRGTFPDDGPPMWCELGRDDLAVQFACGDTPWEGPPGCTGSMYVRPDSVQAVHDAAVGVVEVPWGVEERPWGARELTLRDPDGYFLTFTEWI